MGGGGDAGASAEDHLGGHEFAVVLAQRAGEGLVAGVAGVGGLGPLPDVAEELLGSVGGGAGAAGVEVVGVEEIGCSGAKAPRLLDRFAARLRAVPLSETDGRPEQIG